jgi:transcriptional regulator with XRE-family HTH domain
MRATRFSDFWNKLRDARYRHGFVSSQLKRSIPLQIRALRQQRRLSQAALAKQCGLTQGAISRAENPEYGDLSFNTVLRIARGLDVAFVGRFVSFGDFEEITRNYATAFEVTSFDEEDQELVKGQVPASPEEPAEVRYDHPVGDRVLESIGANTWTNKLTHG